MDAQLADLALRYWHVYGLVVSTQKNLDVQIGRIGLARIERAIFSALGPEHASDIEACDVLINQMEFRARAGRSSTVKENGHACVPRMSTSNTDT